MNVKSHFLQGLGLAALVLVMAGCAAVPLASANTSNNQPTSGQSASGQSASGQPSGSLASAQGAGGGGAPALVQSSPNGSTGITVTGSGKAAGAPDIATITVGVQTEAVSVQQAVSDNQKAMNALLVSLKALGIADKDMTTSNYNVSTNGSPKPVEPGGANTPSAVTYQVSNQVLVTVRDISKLGDVLDKSVAAGANTIYGVNFAISDPSKLQAAAEADAVQDAKNRAENLAKLEGVTLGSLVSVSESYGSPSPYLPANAYAIGGGGTPIQPGQMDVTVSLVVTYSIK